MRNQGVRILVTVFVCATASLSAWGQDTSAEVIFTPPAWEAFQEWAGDFIENEIQARKPDGHRYVQLAVHGVGGKALNGVNLGWLENWLQSRPESRPNGELVLKVSIVPDPYDAAVTFWEPRWASYGWTQAVLMEFRGDWYHKRKQEVLQAHQGRREEAANEAMTIGKRIEALQEDAVHPLYGTSLDPIRERLTSLDDEMFKLRLEQARVQARRDTLMKHLQQAQPGPEAPLDEQARESEEALRGEFAVQAAEYEALAERVRDLGAGIALAQAELEAIGRSHKPEHPIFREAEEALGALRAQKRAAEEELRDRNRQLRSIRANLGADSANRQEGAAAPTGWLDEMLIDAEVRAAEVEAAMALNRERQEEFRAALRAADTRQADIAKLTQQLDELREERDRLQNVTDEEIQLFPWPEVRFIETEEQAPTAEVAQ